MATAQPNPKDMEFRMMGNTGLQVSLLSFGFWATFGVKEGVDKAVAVMRRCREYGINLFDNAEAYGNNNGDAETIMGIALKRLIAEDPEAWRRSDIVISTKIYWGPGGGKNEKGVSRKHLMEGLDASLRRLQLDYVDIVFCHRPDPLTPIEETVRGMTQLVRDGKALYWGTSEWSSQEITEAFWLAKMNGLIPPCVEQPEYNMFTRDRVENEYQSVYRAPYGIGTTIWSPLASGILTGKYNNGIPKGSRLAQPGYEFLKRRLEKRLPFVRGLEPIARKLNCSLAALAIAWCMKNHDVSTVLLGATSVEQLDQNMEALAVARRMTPNDMDEIDNILGNKPKVRPHFGRYIKSTL